jgi:hypothetical protein
MSGPAVASDASSPRVLVFDANRSHDVFDVLSIEEGAATAATVIRVRSPFLFEIGESLALRIECDGAVSDARARVRAHTGPAEARITELEITDRDAPAPEAGG